MRKSWDVVYKGRCITADENEHRVEVWMELVRQLEKDHENLVGKLQGRIENIRNKAIQQQSVMNAWRSTIADLRKAHFPHLSPDDINNMFEVYFAQEKLLEGSRTLDDMLF